MGWRCSREIYRWATVALPPFPRPVDERAMLLLLLLEYWSVLVESVVEVITLKCDLNMSADKVRREGRGMRVYVEVRYSILQVPAAWKK